MQANEADDIRVARACGADILVREPLSCGHSRPQFFCGVKGSITFLATTPAPPSACPVMDTQFRKRTITA
jgi:hypothetical protein